MLGLRSAGHGQLLVPKYTRLCITALESSKDLMWSEVAISLLLLVFIFSDALVEAQNSSNFSTSFSFQTFSWKNKWNVLPDGDTVYNQSTSSYDLNAGGTTVDKVFSCSRLVYKDAVRMLDKASGTIASFSTSFTFSFMSPFSPLASTCGDGLVFTFGTAANMSIVETELGGPEFCLIDFFHKTNSSSGVFAVEFDSYNNGPSCDDLSDGHIGVDLNSKSLASFNLCGVDQDTCSYFCGDKGDFTAWIDYDGAQESLEVRFAKGSFGVRRPPNANLTVYKLRLDEVFDEYMYVGFSASTGYAKEQHRIRSWDFNSSFLPRASSTVIIPIHHSNSSLEPKLIAGIISAFVGALMLTFLYYFCFRQYRRKGSSDKHADKRLEQLSGTLEGLSGDSRSFTYRELKRMTKNFNESQLLSSGGYGDVYKGTLPSGDLVAVKRFKPNVEHGQESFLAEATSLRQIRHRNLLQLRGWCHAKEGLLIVYEYMSNGSLDKWLHQNPNNLHANTEILSWNSRRFILAGVAAGLAYLHEEWLQCVLHRDIKSSNVMLDTEFNAYLGDFGLARMVDHQKLQKTTLLAGTLGYMAPDMQYTGRATKESDVYAFGILVLEVMCGKPPLDLDAEDPREFVLLDYVWHAHELGRLATVADPRLPLAPPATSNPKLAACKGSTSSNEPNMKDIVTRILQLGLLCCLPNPGERPSMRLVSQWLRASESSILELPPLPATKPFFVYRTFTPSCLMEQLPDFATVRDNSQEFTSSSNSITDAAPE